LRGLFATDFAALLLGILLLQSIVPVAAAQEREIAYDGGTPGGSASVPYAPHMWSGGSDNGAGGGPFLWIGNQMLAVRFTPSVNAVEMLLGFRFYIAGDLASFNVWLFDSNRLFIGYAQYDTCDISPYSWANPCDLTSLSSDIPYRWTVTPTSIGWAYLNVTDFWNPIFITNDFYVAIEFTVDQKPRLGVDTIGPRSSRGWFVANESDAGWIEYSAYSEQHGLPDGNLMIRTLTTSLPKASTTETTQTSTQTPSQPSTIPATIQTNAIPEWALLISTALACLIVAVGVWHIRKH